MVSLGDPPYRLSRSHGDEVIQVRSVFMVNLRHAREAWEVLKNTKTVEASPARTEKGRVSTEF